MKPERTLYVTEQDLRRLERLLAATRRTENVEALEEELDRATTVQANAVPPDVVTMNSRVRFKDVLSGEESEVTLVYPQDADIAEGRVSVLAPVGSALLGLSVGQSIEWPMPSGKVRAFEITSVLFQPEAAGRFDL